MWNLIKRLNSNIDLCPFQVMIWTTNSICHGQIFFFSVFTGLMLNVVFHFVDTSIVVDNHCLDLHFITIIE